MGDLDGDGGPIGSPGGGRGLPMLVLYRPDERAGYIPVHCVTTLLNGMANVMDDHADTGAVDVRACSDLLRWHAGQINYHLGFAQLQAAIADFPADEPDEGPPLRRGGILNPRNWVTRRR